MKLANFDKCNYRALTQSEVVSVAADTDEVEDKEVTNVVGESTEMLNVNE